MYILSDLIRVENVMLFEFHGMENSINRDSSEFNIIAFTGFMIFRSFRPVCEFIHIRHFHTHHFTTIIWRVTYGNDKVNRPEIRYKFNPKLDRRKEYKGNGVDIR